MSATDSILERIDCTIVLEAAAAGTLAGLAFAGLENLSESQTATPNRGRCPFPRDGQHLRPAAVRELERGGSVVIDRHSGPALELTGATADETLDEDEATEIDVEGVREDVQDDDSDDDLEDVAEKETKTEDLDVDHQASDGLDVGAEADEEGSA